MDPRENGADSRPLLHLDRVGRTYFMGEVAVEVLRDVSIEIGRAEILAIVGPSGSGKSTLLNLIGGLDKPTTGSVWFRDRDLAQLGSRELTLYRRDTVGFVFQFYNLVPSLTARENVLAATEISRNPLDVDETLDMVGLADRAEHFPSQMSGGEQQRVAIARALASNPQLLLCDEPTGALDFETGKRVLRLLVEVRERLGKTVLIITHNSAIAQVADRIIRLRSGEVVETTVNRQPVAPEEVVW
ncbi:MAG TPA: ABC transporter ATP-binding protein [Pirellulales bacterium]|nr:ABC transporter ATP-binding protein [Pirellulales bacterium]